jgi:hypothetical protein
MNEFTYQLIDFEIGQMIIRSDGASIPIDESNLDYADYVIWLQQNETKA